MNNTRPLILVTNDDGMFAPGIKRLVSIAQHMGEVIVVAPNSPQSAKGHAVTLHDPIRLHKVNVFDNIEAYECSGTPVDCVKLAKNVILKNRKIDLCVSGINHGSNASINILYSGTMSAAMEASIEGINSIGFSLDDYSMDADFDPATPWITSIMQYVLTNGLSHTKLLNINIPHPKLGAIKGMRICRQSEGRWEEEFVDGEDPRGVKFYWLTGNFACNDRGPDTDMFALSEGYISIVPSLHDLTQHPAIPELKSMERLNPMQ
ncbi:MAG: 5'/3'-nucleotidase SurE [Bacteroidota bacterium]|nr:5'/3'-nucleotidase SurE [Bacteroidota bacterium]